MADSVPAGVAGDGGRRELTLFLGAAAELARRAGALLALEHTRWILFLPVGLGIGIGVYFDLAVEPEWWIAPASGAALLALAALARRRRAAAGFLLALASICAGAALAQSRAERVAAPVLASRWGPGELSGRIVALEHRPEGRRMILDRLAIPGLAADATPARIRLKLAAAPATAIPGARVAVRASLQPPPEPAIPGAYDFRRHAWFERLGAVGSAHGPPRVIAPAANEGWTIALNAARASVVAAVLAREPGPAGQITAALLTGEMGHIDPALMQAMRDSGLAHLLSISGLHISLVAAIVFFVVRRLLALVPPLALRWPVKKIAAVAAFAGVTLYMLFAAPGVPTTRAWLMSSIVLFAIVIDRAALTMRLVAWAAVVVLATTPEALLGPSFQMSFAAVVALIAAWEAWAGAFSRARLEAGMLRRAGLALAATALTSLVASLATAPYALYHFNRVAAWGLAANLVAVPLTSLVVMPAAVAAFALMPFGLEGPALEVMNLGNAAVVRVAEGVAAWPAAGMLLPAMPAWGLATLTLGGVWLCLWRTRWRLAGIAAIAAGLASAGLASAPDLVVAGDGRLIAVRGGDGRVALAAAPRQDYVREIVLRRAGESEAASFPAPGAPASDFACDADGCRLRRAGQVVALVRRPTGLTAACREATVLATPLALRHPCAAPAVVIDRAALARDGGHALRFRPDGSIEVETVRAWRGERPWTARR